MGSPSEKAGKAAGKVKKASKAIQGYGAIFQRLAEEHGEVSTLMKRVQASDDKETRIELFHEIKKELLSHAHAEEREFYEPLEKHPKTRSIAVHSKKEHEEIEELLGKLEGMIDNPTGAAWDTTFDKLQETVTHHVKEEENELFPKAHDVLSDQEAKEVEERYAKAKQRELKKVA